MALPDIPAPAPGTVGARPGSLFNAIRKRLYAQTLLSSATIKISDTDRGQQIDYVAGRGAANLDLGFAVTHTGSSVQVAAGKVLTPSYSGASGSDFKVSDWAVESNFTGATLSSSATAVWLKIEFSETDTESEGNLSTKTYDISGGAGGHGAGGGGGGAANQDASDHYVTVGASGQDGSVGGAGGAGGGVFEVVDNDPVSTTGGFGGDGGDGAAGGDGGDGTTVTFTRHTKGVVQVRHYTLSGISAHATKGASSEGSAWIKLASIASGEVTQHHIGVLRLTPAAVTFLEP